MLAANPQGNLAATHEILEIVYQIGAGLALAACYSRHAAIYPLCRMPPGLPTRLISTAHQPAEQPYR